MVGSVPTSAEQNILSGLKTRTTPLSSRQLSQWDERIKKEALFSARTTSKAYVDRLKQVLYAVASRNVIPEVAQERLQAELANLGYTPQGGFGDGSKVPPATPGAITDLSSSRRIQLILDTNVKRARSMGQVAASEDPIFMLANPAWRLTRTGARKKPRGDWRNRWQAAGNSVGWRGAIKTDFVALKTSPIWEALGKGVGGYDDSLGSGYPPFAFGSGLAWVNVGRREWRAICQQNGVSDGLEDLKRGLSTGEDTPIQGENPSITDKLTQEPPLDQRKRDSKALIAEALKRYREQRQRQQTTFTPPSTRLPETSGIPAEKKPIVSKARISAEKEILATRTAIEDHISSLQRLYIASAEKTLDRIRKMADQTGLTPIDASEEIQSVENAITAYRGIVEELTRLGDNLTKYEAALKRNQNPTEEKDVASFDRMMNRYQIAAAKVHGQATDAYQRKAEANDAVKEAYQSVRRKDNQRRYGWQTSK